MKTIKNSLSGSGHYLFYLGILTGQSACAQKGQDAVRPNIAIIYIDDMGYGDPGCYGNPLIKTPNIDRLAEQGIRFTQFYVNSPVSSPSRVALITGQYPMKFGIHAPIAGSEQNRQRNMNDFLDPEVPTMAEAFHSASYATGHFGKWHMGGGRDIGDVPYPSEYGFEKSLVSFEGIGDRVLFNNDNLSAQSGRLGKGKIIWAEKHMSTSIYVDSALAFIRRNPDKPFYIHLFPNDVHDPHLPDSAQWAKFRHLSDNPFEQKFLAVLDEMDRQIGRFLSGLSELGIRENTLIILASDNGPTDWPYYYATGRYPEGYNGELYPPGFTGGFFGRKWSLYEGGIRVPFIASWPGHIPEGETDSLTLLAGIDLFPTICAMAGLPVPTGVDGTDKSKALLGNPITDVPVMMWEYASNAGGSHMPGNKDFISPSLAIRDGRWKLMIYADSTRALLFDIHTDPKEMHNLVQENPELAEKMAHKVLAWRRKMPVPMKL